MKKIVMGLAVLALSACMQSVPKHWQHPKLPSSQWGSDHTKCKRAADKYLGLIASYEADQDISSFSEQMRQYDAAKKQKKLVADCMRKAGYVPMR
ncbi:hypothetical protein RYZ26_00565 [Terasakiella sp. A23]|uniref:hypothetical protein n=1 Tax=Terasakiella sp. FCG-A23 TaxID=3080561 RepID=UPI00295373DF|nr:hypothetical protein [Terasakiella sp. A23]MDV7338066.1 hypothetical protein [Terasakiella sp. A23]